MRLVDADEVLKKMRSVMDMQDTYLPIHFKELVLDETPTVDDVEVIRCKDSEYYWQNHSIEEALDRFSDEGCPNAVDAVEVVRCKDCKYNYANQIPSDDVCQRCVELPINKDFYCAWGERKEDEID